MIVGGQEMRRQEPRDRALLASEFETLEATLRIFVLIQVGLQEVLLQGHFLRVKHGLVLRLLHHLLGQVRVRLLLFFNVLLTKMRCQSGLLTHMGNLNLRHFLPALSFFLSLLFLQLGRQL